MYRIIGKRLVDLTVAGHWLFFNDKADIVDTPNESGEFNTIQEVETHVLDVMHKHPGTFITIQYKKIEQRVTWEYSE